MTDQELIMLAAKAAAIEGDPSETIGGFPCIVPYKGFIGQPWQPLHDDGDALRLAAKLRIRITWSDDCVFARKRPNAYTFEAFNRNGGDEQASLRRAIVRAAAALAV